jgi:hypothetical protein
LPRFLISEKKEINITVIIISKKKIFTTEFYKMRWKIQISTMSELSGKSVSRSMLAKILELHLSQMTMLMLIGNSDFKPAHLPPQLHGYFAFAVGLDRF